MGGGQCPSAIGGENAFLQMLEESCAAMRGLAIDCLELPLPPTPSLLCMQRVGCAAIQRPQRLAQIASQARLPHQSWPARSPGTKHLPTRRGKRDQMHAR